MDLFAAHDIILRAMADHGLSKKGWNFEWDRAKTRCGQCRYSDRTITISQHFAELNDESEVRDTILHEIAHALVGPGYGHTWIWKLKAQEIGARPLRCSTSEAQTQGRYIGRCVGCGYEQHAYRRPRYMDTPGTYSHIPCKRAGRQSEIEWRRA